MDEMTKYVMDSIPEVSAPLTMVAIGGEEEHQTAVR